MTDEAILSVDAIEKRFAGVHALANVTVAFRAGRVHCLAGENGSGKSTLIKVVSGVEVPDSGTITLAGRAYRALKPREAIMRGVQVIYQDLSLFPNLSVGENIAVGPTIASHARWYNPRRAQRIAERVAARINVSLPFAKLAGDVRIAERQLTAICRALAEDARVLFMDEPTTALTRREVDSLFAVVRLLRAQGVAVVFVSHKFDEVLGIADQITVLRNGRIAADGPAADFDRASLSEAMTGKRVDLLERREPAKEDAAVLLRAAQIEVAGSLARTTLTLRHGEILGVTGLLGSGRKAIAEALFGVHPITSGEISIDGERCHIASVADAIARGIGYVPGDRLSEGLFLKHSIGQNIVAASTDDIPRTAGLILRRAVRAIALRMIEAFAIKTPTPEVAVRTLSGGNQQRVVLAKWFVTKPRILILNGPTVGVDIGSKREILALLRALSVEGTAIIVISDDVPELVEVADKVVVMRNGAIAAQLLGPEIREDRILHELAA